ncbi:MAG: 16S rRNA (guanine(527)-N(7))-methyltransferase RsmG, partial [Tissierellia bacterium]|nr:16S rRNA (guanine(527)-N(7))-methyltransferase RsmG [Tissierellia bacterium]
GKLRDVIEFNLTEDENSRTLVVIEKVKKTPEKYPRQFGQIKNKPL